MKSKTKAVVVTVGTILALALGGGAGYGFGYGIGHMTASSSSIKTCDDYLAEASRIVQSRPAEESQDQLRTITTYDDYCVISITTPNNLPQIEDGIISTSEAVVLQDGTEAVVTVYEAQGLLDNKAQSSIFIGIFFSLVGAAVAAMGAYSGLDDCIYECDEVEEKKPMPLPADSKKEETKPEPVIQKHETVQKHEVTEEEIDELGVYTSKLHDFIEEIKDLTKKSFFKGELTGSINKSVSLLQDIEKFIESKDLDNRNVQKLNSYFLPKYLDMITAYCQYYNRADSQLNYNYIQETKATIIQSEEIFKAILDTVLANDMLNMVTEAKVYAQVALQNGLLETNSIINNKQVKQTV